MSMEALTKNIDNLRKSQGLSISKFARIIGYSTETVRRWLCGRTYPHVEALYMIRKEFGVSIDSLFEGVEE